MKGFLTIVAVDHGEIDLNIGQIASVKRDRRSPTSRYFAVIRMSNGDRFESTEEYRLVRLVIDEALQSDVQKRSSHSSGGAAMLEKYADPPPAKPTPPIPTDTDAPGAVGAALQAAVVKRRGRPPKGTS